MNKFEVGNRVKVTSKRRSNASANHFGEIGTVIRRSGGDAYNLDIEDGDDHGFWEDELTKVVMKRFKIDGFRGKFWVYEKEIELIVGNAELQKQLTEIQEQLSKIHKQLDYISRRNELNS